MVLLFLPGWNLIAYANLGSTPELPKLLFSLVGWFAGHGMRHSFLQGNKQENRSADPEGTEDARVCVGGAGGGGSGNWLTWQEENR